MERLTQIWLQLRTQLVADKKKAAVLGVLFLVLVVVTLQLAWAKSPPSSAVATPVAAAADPTPVAQASAPALTRPSPQSVVAPSGNPAGAHIGGAGGQSPVNSTRVEPTASAIASGAKLRRVSIGGMSRIPARDPFSTPAWNRFAPAIIVDAPLAGGDRAARDPNGFWSVISNGITARQKERMAELRRIDKELEELELQSTMTGPDPLAHISGHLVRPGHLLRGFSILQIDDRRVTLSKFGVTRELSMR